MHNTVIIGAGQAGYSVASRLRKENYEGSITLLGDEPHSPYQRPPLSKKYLLGDMAAERLSLRKSNYYDDNAIKLITGCSATAIDMNKRNVVSSSGTHPFDHLVFATGSVPRTLPANLGGNLNNVFTIRGISDIDEIRGVIETVQDVVVVGGGYIGLEAAAVFSSLDKQVVIIEAGARILQRVACNETSDYFRHLHQDNGVEIRENSQLKTIEPDQESLRAHLEDGSSLAADIVLVGIGASPVVSLAEQSKLSIDPQTGGIQVDEYGHTNIENVWAAGDCAAFKFREQQIRLESVQNAIDQAETVACNITGQSVTYEPTPWFWSDQYKTKLQIAGLNMGYTRVVQRLGDKPGSLSNWYYDDETIRSDQGELPRLLAVDAINDAIAYMTARKLLENGRSIDPDKVKDTETDLKTYISKR